MVLYSVKYNIIWLPQIAEAFLHIFLYSADTTAGDYMSVIRIIGSDSKPVYDAISQKFEINSQASQDNIDLLILTPTAKPPFPSCNILLIPDVLSVIPSCSIAISYGMSYKSSVTLSSIGKRSVLSIQRELATLNGDILEPQEIPVSNLLSLTEYALMASMAALLIMGIPPKLLS